MPSNLPAYPNHWARASRIERMRFARECPDMELRAKWVDLAKKMQRIYLSDARNKRAYMEWLREDEPVSKVMAMEKAITGRAA